MPSYSEWSETMLKTKFWFYCNLYLGYCLSLWWFQEKYVIWIKYSGFLTAVISGLLMFGVRKSCPASIQVWMLLTLMKLSIVDILFGVNVADKIYNGLPVELLCCIVAPLYFVHIILQIVGFYLGAKALQEINRKEGYSQIPSQVAKQASPA